MTQCCYNAARGEWHCVPPGLYVLHQPVCNLVVWRLDAELLGRRTAGTILLLIG